MEIKIGQRWLWNDSNFTPDISQIINLNTQQTTLKVICLPNGKTNTALFIGAVYKEPNIRLNKSRCFRYLSNQDKPEFC